MVARKPAYKKWWLSWTSRELKIHSNEAAFLLANELKIDHIKHQFAIG